MLAGKTDPVEPIHPGYLIVFLVWRNMKISEKG